jgi:predicted RNA-binding protein associated with RNAse of E/G family
LQDPLRRTRTGFDTSDHVLDLVIARDGSWRWKDEHEFEAACRLGRFTPEEAVAVRQAGEAAAAAVEARAWPFDSEWSEWRPDPNWTVPTLPADMSGL